MQNSRLKIGENGLTQRREAANRVLAHGQSFRTGDKSKGQSPRSKVKFQRGGQDGKEDEARERGHTPACLGGRWPLLCPVNAAA
jgi:hypothetical protein